MRMHSSGRTARRNCITIVCFSSRPPAEWDPSASFTEPLVDKPPAGAAHDGNRHRYRVIATNLRGTFLVLAQAAQHVVSGGRIIAFSTSVIARSFPTYGPYIASKAGVEGLVHVLANELRGRNITVNAVAPGPVATELFLTGKTDEQIDQLRRLPPLERLGEPDDIAGVVSFLAGPDGGWVNAQVLRANGGFA